MNRVRLQRRVSEVADRDDVSTIDGGVVVTNERGSASHRSRSSGVCAGGTRTNDVAGWPISMWVGMFGVCALVLGSFGLKARLPEDQLRLLMLVTLQIVSSALGFRVAASVLRARSVSGGILRLAIVVALAFLFSELVVSAELLRTGWGQV